MAQGSKKNTPYMAPGLIRDKVADRFAALNPLIRTTPLSGQDLRDRIGRTLLIEAHGLYTQWQQQDTEGILRKSADTLEIILAGLKLHGLDETDLLQARQERPNMFGSYDQGLYLQGPASETAHGQIDDIPSFLFTPGQADRLVCLIRSELERSDRAWIASAFYSPGVTNLLISNFIRFMEGGGRLFVLTSTMGNVNRPDHLVHLRDFVPGIQVRVYHPPNIPSDTARPGFHPKAYLFRHRDGRGALLIGSSNFTEAGFLRNVEWNYFSSDEVNLPFDGQSPFEAILREFMRHWDQESVALSDDFLSAYRTRWEPHPDMGRRGIFEPPAAEWSPPPVRPNPAQVEALENLSRMREHGVKKASVIAATGVGKTHLAAFDYKASGAPRLLFIAHRENILVKAREIFRSVLARQDFGEILGAGRPGSSAPEAVFGMIQTLAKEDTLNRLGPGHFDYLIVDEFHHGMAPTYLRAIDHFNPRFLLGLTATPERMDGRDVLRLCDYNIAYEVRLLDAVDKGWLSPFQYFAIHDETDYRQITWRGTRYDEEELTRALSKDTRTAIVARNLKKFLPSQGKIKALAFCSSVSHALFTARKLTTDHAIEATALTGDAPGDERARTIARLQDENEPLNVICTVDRFNEGVDILEVTHVLFLRPTQSFTVFLQQLGRGLRKSPGKEFLVAIDFIGNFRKAHVAPLALKGYTSTKDFLDDNPRIGRKETFTVAPPAGCHISADVEVRRIWDDEIKTIIRGTSVEDRLRALYNDIRADLDNESPTLMDFLANPYEVDPYVFIKHFGSWLNTKKACEGALPPSEECLMGTPAEAFLRHLEKELSPVRSYKMVVMKVLLSLPGTEWNVNDIAKGFLAYYLGHPGRLADYDDLSRHPSPDTYPLARVKSHLLKNPLKYMSTTARDWFILEQERFRLKPELAPYWDETFFRRMVEDRVEFTLTRYFHHRLDRLVARAASPAPDPSGA